MVGYSRRSYFGMLAGAFAASSAIAATPYLPAGTDGQILVTGWREPLRGLVGRARPFVVTLNGIFLQEDGRDWVEISRGVIQFKQPTEVGDILGIWPALLIPSRT